MKNICPLCKSSAENFYEDTQKYYECPTCKAIFVDPDDLPKEDEEIERYEMHDTDTEDVGYRNFVSPITSSVVRDFPPEARGLDFGAGRSAIISVVLGEQGYDVANYDPYFHNHPELLEEEYDYITSCEVIEHLYNPYKEFKQLRKMLKSGGRLYLMTDIYDGRDFGSWYYKNDPTHVFLYTKETFEWIKEHFDFKTLEIDKRFILLS